MSNVESNLRLLLPHSAKAASSVSCASRNDCEHPQAMRSALAGRQANRRGKSSVHFGLVLALPLLLFAGVSSAQYPVVDEVANRVVQHYQQSSCEQLWQQRGKPRSQREQQAIQLLHQDPQMRAAFIDRVAAPIANKMFECGLIP
jgi:hypothetical protein